jgi:NADH-quinone oxidoreductase subunit M
MNSDAMLLSAIIFLPTIGAIILLAFNKKDVEPMRYFAFAVTVATFILTIFLFRDFLSAPPGSGMLPASASQSGIKLPWIANWNINYQLGYDGISLPLVLLTSFITMLAMMASWSITKQVKGYLVLFLILETGMLGVFLALDFFLFYVFWEVMLLPMYFLIGVWGGPRKEYAAIKFFLYTLAGGVLMLIAILMFYFNSGNPQAHVPNTFDIIELSKIGQGLVKGVQFTPTVQITAFILLFIGFAIKVPSVPFHTWLPDSRSRYVLTGRSTRLTLWW